jgi:glycosyltransferase involved in cell wall biosynthesis
VTRFTGQKRVDQLISAFALVTENNSSVKLQIFGAGPLKHQTENLINKLGLKERISLFKPVDQSELGRIYNQSAVVVLNSFQEGFGLALSEAMLCGAAVIGTASGGITDIIEHEKTGLLVEVDNPPALAKALSRLLDDDNLRARLAGQGHSFAGEIYSSKALAGRYARLVKNSLSDY